MNINEIIDLDCQNREERKVTSWQASKLGGCLAGVYLERIGVPQATPIDPLVYRKFKCGNLFEDYIVSTIEKSGIKIEKQVRVENKEHDATGYADFTIGDEVVEVKSVHSRSFWYMVKKGEGAYRHHQLQLMLYMMTLGYKSGRLVYVSKDDLCIQEYPLSIDNIEIKEELINNLNILNNALKTGVMPAPADPDSFQAKYCNWHPYCTGALPIPTV